MKKHNLNPSRYTIMAVVAIASFGSIAQSMPQSFEIEATVIVGTAAEKPFRVDNMSLGQILSHAHKSSSLATVGIWCYPGGSYIGATAFDVVSNGTISQRAKTYGGTAQTPLQALCSKNSQSVRR